MTNKIPSTSEVRELLRRIKQPALELMSRQADVPVATIIKIRHGITANPGLETVRRIYGSGVMRAKLKGKRGVSKGKPASDSMTQPKTEV